MYIQDRWILPLKLDSSKGSLSTYLEQAQPVSFMYSCTCIVFAVFLAIWAEFPPFGHRFGRLGQSSQLLIYAVQNGQFGAEFPLLSFLATHPPILDHTLIYSCPKWAVFLATDFGHLGQSSPTSLSWPLAIWGRVPSHALWTTLLALKKAVLFSCVLLCSHVDICM